MNENTKELYGKIMQLLTANWITQPLFVVTSLGIPDMLEEGTESTDSLAQATGSHAPYLYRVMRALASVGFFQEEGDRKFSITPLGAMLTKSKMEPIVLMFLSGWHTAAWSELPTCVQTGGIPFDTAFGRPCFDWLNDHEDEADIFNRAQHIKAVASHTAVCDVYDFSECNSIVDIGGGYGGLLYHVLHTYPQAEGVVADLPYMAEEVETRIVADELSERCSFQECDMFRVVPGGGDCYLLSNILHDWDDEKCLEILRVCREAMPQSAKLVIIEAIIPGRDEFSIAKLLDLEVLVMGGGKERTLVEYRSLLHGAGFTLDRAVSTTESVSIMECVIRS